MSKKSEYFEFYIEISDLMEECSLAYTKKAELGSTIGFKAAEDEAMSEFLKKYPQFDDEKKKKFLKKNRKIYKKKLDN